MGEHESWLNVGEEGAVEIGELGRDFLAFRCEVYWSSSSWECERDMGLEWVSGGSCVC